MKKVSILTPCYNSAVFIHRLLDSVLEQTYPNIEMFVINDGSTDNSEEIINSYIPKFNAKKISLECVNQSNQGQAAAINNGLKYISGNYLIWPDSDDFFSESKSIEIMVRAFENNSDISMVRCLSSVLDDKTLKKISQYGKKEINKKSRNLFEDCLFEKNNFWFGAGNYMLKTSILDYYYPNREIYSSNIYGGQNWQLLLPGLYKKKCITINETLHSILARDNSHSRVTSSNLNNILLKYEEHERIILTTLEYIKDMSKSELLIYKKDIIMKYSIIKVRTLLSFDQKKRAKIEYRKFKDQIHFKDKLLIQLGFLPYFEKIKSRIKVFLHE